MDITSVEVYNTNKSLRYVQISKKGNYGSVHNFQEHLN